MTDKLYHSIGEVSQMLHVNPSLLRFWETEFPAIKPHKNKKGTRYYTDDDIDRDKQLVKTLTEARQFLVDLKEYL